MTEVTVEQSQDYINANKTRSLMESLNVINEEVRSSVKDSVLADTVTNTIKDQQNKMNACIKELIARGKASQVGMFIAKCMDNIKIMLNKLVGHIKELWARIVAMFDKQVVVAAAA